MTEMTETVCDVRGMVGESPCRSRWFTMMQAMIDAHADLIEDWQFIHVDPVRASSSPLGGTVAHGFLVLSMLSAMSYDALPVFTGITHSVNYGFNRIRFVSPVRPEARIRGSFLLKAFEEGVQGENTLMWDVEAEIEGHPKPALGAEWIVRHYLD